MKKSFITKMTLLFALTALIACTKQNTHADPTKMTAREAMGLVANDFGMIVDVREKEEIDEEGMAAPAKWLALSAIEKDAGALGKLVEGVSKEKQIVFYCVSGSRAEMAAKKLASQGYKTGYFTGFYEWKNAGLPIKKP